MAVISKDAFGGFALLKTNPEQEPSIEKKEEI
jgi:hypothetical protein